MKAERIFGKVVIKIYLGQIQLLMKAVRVNGLENSQQQQRGYLAKVDLGNYLGQIRRELTFHEGDLP